MVPSLEQVVRYRYVATFVLRILGLVLGLYGFVSNGPWVAEAIRGGDFFQSPGFYIGWMIPSMGMMAGGIILFFIARPLACVLMPLSRPECPRCGYALRNRGTAHCSECGLRLSAAFTDDVAATSTDVPIRVPPMISPRDSQSTKS